MPPVPTDATTSTLANSPAASLATSQGSRLA